LSRRSRVWVVTPPPPPPRLRFAPPPPGEGKHELPPTLILPAPVPTLRTTRRPGPIGRSYVEEGAHAESPSFCRPRGGCHRRPVHCCLARARRKLAAQERAHRG